MKKYLFTVGGKDFYDDSTFRCVHWPPHEFTEWYIEGNLFHYRHIEMTKFLNTERIDGHEEIRAAWDKATTLMMEKAFDFGE